MISTILGKSGPCSAVPCILMGRWTQWWRSGPLVVCEALRTTCWPDYTWTPLELWGNTRLFHTVLTPEQQSMWPERVFTAVNRPHHHWLDDTDCTSIFWHPRTTRTGWCTSDKSDSVRYYWRSQRVAAEERDDRLINNRLIDWLINNWLID